MSFVGPYERPHENQTATGRRTGQYPKFELECRPDDPDHPTEVTLFPRVGGENQDTEWISADVETALEVDEWI